MTIVQQAQGINEAAPGAVAHTMPGTPQAPGNIRVFSSARQDPAGASALEDLQSSSP